MTAADRLIRALARHRPLLVFTALLAVLIALKGRFNGFDARALAVNTLPLALIALGQYLVILTRGVDLSLGPVASVAGAAPPASVRRR